MSNVITDAVVEMAARAVFADALVGGRRFEDMPPTAFCWSYARAALTAVLPAILEAAEREAWRPMETAPRDGTPILGCNRYGFVHRIRWEGRHGWIDHYGGSFTPLYWRPLPTPPAADAEGGV